MQFDNKIKKKLWVSCVKLGTASLFILFTVLVNLEQSEVLFLLKLVELLE